MKQLNVAALLIVILISTASLAFAKFTLEPSVTIRETYNDNILLVDSGEEDDFITTVTPRVNLDYAPNESFDITLDWGLNFRYYADHKKLNDLDLDEILDVDLKAHARPSSRVYIDASDTFKRAAVDVRRKTAEDNFFINKTDKNTFSISPYTELPLTATLTTKIGYVYTNTWYRGGDAVDSQSHSGFVTLNKRFTTKVNGEVRYEYYAYRPDDSEGSTKEKYYRHQASVSAAYQIRPEFSINGKVGESWFDYDTRNDMHTFFWNVGTDYKLKIAPDTSLSAKYGITFHDSATSGPYKSHRVDLDFESGKEFKISVKPFYSFDKYQITDRRDYLTGAVVDISRPISERLTLKVNGTGERQKFLPEDDRVNKYSVGPGVDYILTKDITTGIGYRYSGYKKTNQGAVIDRYRNSIVWLQAKVTF